MTLLTVTGNKKIIYQLIHTETILKETYGVMLYREQIMKIAVDMAGFSLPDRLITQSYRQENPEVWLSSEIIEGAVTNGVRSNNRKSIY